MTVAELIESSFVQLLDDDPRGSGRSTPRDEIDLRKDLKCVDHFHKHYEE